MKTFTDSFGQTWTVALNIGAVKRLKGLLGVDIMNLHEGDPPLISRLGTDVILVCDVIFALVKPQADQLGVTDEQFAAGLGGEAILAAHTAFYEELTSFFQNLGRPDMAKAVTTQGRLIEKAVALAMAKIEALNAEKMVETMFAESKGPPTSGEASMSSPASPE
jgi:hypothetical protein